MSRRTGAAPDGIAPEHPVINPARGGFVLSRPHGTVIAHRPRELFDDIGTALGALRSGAAAIIVGAIPFARDHPSALSAPEAVTRTSGTWVAPGPRRAIPAFDVQAFDVSEHLDRVVTAVHLMRHDSADLRKVVLARRITLTSDVPAAPLDLLSALVDGTPAGNGYCVDLSAAGGSFVGKSLVGSSPEVLIRRCGNVVTCHPLAGSAARHVDPEEDRASGANLAESAKDLHEHSFVVDAIRDALAPFCSTLEVPQRPSLTHTPQLWHLGTAIKGTLRDSGTSALELAAALHPTPAVCGTPTDLAYDVIAELEGDRGFYGGAVGWCDTNGDGEWMVAIRCAEISGDGRRVTAYAGGGIVAESDPDDELRETVVKFGTVLKALGVGGL